MKASRRLAVTGHFFPCQVVLEEGAGRRGRLEAGSAMIRFEQIQYHEGFHEGFTGYDSSPWYRWPIEIDGLMMVYRSEKWVGFPWLC